jgi:Protein of unknown function (DUF551)
MTPEEFLRSKHVYDGTTVYDRSAKEATIEVVELLEEYASIKLSEASAWVDIKDRLPDVGHDPEYPYSSQMILLSDGESVYYGQFEDVPMLGQSFIDIHGDDFVEYEIQITHWMPLPPAPNKN